MKNKKFGFICFGEVNTAIEKLSEKHNEALEFLKENIKAEYIDGKIVIDDNEYKTAEEAVKILKKDQDFSCLILCVAGWIPTHAVIEVIDHFSHTPMLLWGLCGNRKKGHIVTTAEQAGTSALRPVMEEMGFSFKFVYNSIDQKWPLQKISSYLQACHVKKALRSVVWVKYKIKDKDVFEKAYSYIEQYY